MATIRLRLRELLAERATRPEGRPQLEEIAAAIGLSPQTLVSMADNQTDHISLRALAALCDYLNATPAELLHYEPAEGAATEPPMSIDAREIVERWESNYGRDEHPRE